MLNLTAKSFSKPIRLEEFLYLKKNYIIVLFLLESFNLKLVDNKYLKRIIGHKHALPTMLFIEKFDAFDK